MKMIKAGLCLLMFLLAAESYSQQLSKHRIYMAVGPGLLNEHESISVQLEFGHEYELSSKFSLQQGFSLYSSVHSQSIRFASNSYGAAYIVKANWSLWTPRKFWVELTAGAGAYRISDFQPQTGTGSVRDGGIEYDLVKTDDPGVGYFYKVFLLPGMNLAFRLNSRLDFKIAVEQTFPGTISRLMFRLNHKI